MKTKRKILLGLVLIIAVLVLYLALWPVPIDPQAWTPPEAPPLAGDYQPNDRLAAIEKLKAGHHPEGVAVDAAGHVYAGLDDGRIVRLTEGGEPQDFARMEGRPLGIQFDAAGNLLVAGGDKGLVSFAPDGTATVLATEAQGQKFRCVNDLDVAADGTIYFSDSSYKFPISIYKQDLFEHRPNGRLLAYDPQTKQTRVVLGGLYFANGVAVSPDQSFVLLSETGKYRVLRVWLQGARAGQSENFIDNLPGFPDNITSNGKDEFWLALVTPRNHLLDSLLPRPFLRKVVLRLPPFLQPAPARYAFALGLDLNGHVRHNLQDPTGKSFGLISSVLESNGQLYFGSIGEEAVGRLPVPAK
ncbi:MAG: SMP-30/gluconolactonase/LRE family protein [Acidobacteria bacterium]|nr:SMP-30/gluconolactonase/LRE family protein [Acidobacteriota bacterium]